MTILKFFVSCFLFPLVIMGAESKMAKNLIYFIGDGMGPATITGARIYQGGSESKLHIEDLEYTGYSKTYSSNGFVTDSAAAATALVSGVKTYDGSIGMSDPSLSKNGSQKLENFFNLAKAKGLSVGIISTARITHATPASFYAYTAFRDDEELIAEQLVTSPFDLFLGGGKSFFYGADTTDEKTSLKGSRKDNKNLIEEIKKSGALYVENAEEFMALTPLLSQKTKEKKKIVGLFNHSHMEFDWIRTETKKNEPSLTEMVDFAIKLLSKNPKGFVLMVEAGKIDHAAHDNRAKLAFTELLAMDKAIARAYQETKNKTLVVVTADHETGGLALQGYGMRAQVRGEALIGNQLKVDGTQDTKNSYIAWSSGPGSEEKLDFDEKDSTARQKSLYADSSAFHTAVDVLVGASGPCASSFKGFMENISIALKISKCLNLNLEKYLK